MTSRGEEEKREVQLLYSSKEIGSRTVKSIKKSWLMDTRVTRSKGCRRQ